MENPYILIVDDNPDVRQLVSDVVRLLNLESKEVENGADALKFLKEAEHHPSLIVLDLMMPVMDGFTTLTHLRSALGGSQIPVILLSAIAEDTEMSNLPNVRGVLKKGSYSIHELRALIEEILGESSIS